MRFGIHSQITGIVASIDIVLTQKQSVVLTHKERRYRMSNAIIAVDQVFFDNYLNHRQGKDNIRSGTNSYPFVRFCGGFAVTGVDTNQFCPVFQSIEHKVPIMHLRIGNVCSPKDKGFGITQIFRFRSQKKGSHTAGHIGNDLRHARRHSEIDTIHDDSTFKNIGKSFDGARHASVDGGVTTRPRNKSHRFRPVFFANRV